MLSLCAYAYLYGITVLISRISIERFPIGSGRCTREYALSSSYCMLSNSTIFSVVCASISCENRNSDWYIKCANCLIRTSGALCGRILAFFHRLPWIGLSENFFCMKQYSSHNPSSCLLSPSVNNPDCPSRMAVIWNKLLRCFCRHDRGVANASSSNGSPLVWKPKLCAKVI